MSVPDVSPAFTTTVASVNADIVALRSGKNNRLPLHVPVCTMALRISYNLRTAAKMSRLIFGTEDNSRAAHFLAGEYVLSGQWAEDRLVHRDRVALYDSTAQAAEYLEEFLRNPPQLWPLKQAAERREISVRLTVGQQGRFLHETFRVNPDRVELSDLTLTRGE
jgi:hypothetical protein